MSTQPLEDAEPDNERLAGPPVRSGLTPVANIIASAQAAIRHQNSRAVLATTGDDDLEDMVSVVRATFRRTTHRSSGKESLIL